MGDKGVSNLNASYFTLYDLDITHEDGMHMWRDERNDVPGHDVALAQTEAFFVWLAKDEEEEEEEDEEEEMAGVVKPMNKASLR